MARQGGLVAFQALTAKPCSHQPPQVSPHKGPLERDVPVMTTIREIADHGSS